MTEKPSGYLNASMETLIYTETKSEIVDWIGESGDKLIGRMTDGEAEKLLDWLKSENIDIEKDMDKVSAHLAKIETP